MLIVYKKPARGRFFIVGKPGSGPVPPTPTMRHIKVNVFGGNGTMTVDGEQVTLDADNYWEADYQDGTQITLAITTDSGHSMCCWFDRTRQLWADNGYTSYDNPLTITMSGDYNIDTQIDTLHNVTLLGASGQGKVGWSGQTPDYSATKTGMYPGMCEDIYAYPETGYEFVEWQTNDFNLDSPTANPSYVCPNNDGTITAVFQATSPQQPNDEIWYTSTDGQVVTPNDTSAFAPATITSNTYSDGKGVIKFDQNLTEVGNNAFEDCSGLTSVTIPNSVTSIGESAFNYCSGLTSVTIPNSVTSIGNNAFEDCSGLTSIVIPDSVTRIGPYAFRYCSSLTSIVIPDSVTSIGEYAFFNCTRLTSVTIPNSVTSIGESAFGNCSGLTSIVVEEGNTVYDSRNNCNAIVKTSTNTLITGCQNTVIPNSVTSIGQFAFGNCSGLTSIVIPDSVTSIGEGAFQDCKSLVAIESLATTAPTIYKQTFRWVAQNGTLTVPNGADYSAWMQTDNYYLGKYNWTLVQQ